MKIQDIGFISVLLLAVYSRKPQMFLYLGIICIALSIPLFSLWIFFTAERLIWYAALCFGIFVIDALIQRKDTP